MAAKINTNTIGNRLSTWINKVSWLEIMVLTLLVAVGVASRFFIDTPNFKPIAALALFGGFYFRKPLVAIVGVILIMALSDFRIGFYPWQMMMCVYGSLAFSVGLGLVIRKRLGQSGFGVSHALGFVGASLVMSTMFFLLTNAAVWFGGWYPPTITGLIDCYIAGLPFFRNTLLGDLTFTSAIVGSYAAAIAMSTGNQTVHRPSEPLLEMK